MGYDTFGLFRGWCRSAPLCLEYIPVGIPEDAGDFRAIRCSKCGCQPQQHEPVDEMGYDPHSAAQIQMRMKYDARLLPPSDRAAKHKVTADAAFKAKNYRTAYMEYSVALEATPDSHTLLANRCQAYLKVEKYDLALLDAKSAVSLGPEWSKGHYRLGSCLLKLERCEEAVEAFREATRLDPESKEATKALANAKVTLATQRTWEDDLAKARKKSTIRQAYNQKCEAEYQARIHAKNTGRMKDMAGWSEEMKAGNAGAGVVLRTGYGSGDGDGFAGGCG